MSVAFRSICAECFRKSVTSNQSQYNWLHIYQCPSVSYVRQLDQDQMATMRVIIYDLHHDGASLSHNDWAVVPWGPHCDLASNWQGLVPCLGLKQVNSVEIVFEMVHVWYTTHSLLGDVPLVDLKGEFYTPLENKVYGYDNDKAYNNVAIVPGQPASMPLEWVSSAMSNRSLLAEW